MAKYGITTQQRTKHTVGSCYTYYEEAETAQAAVDVVRTYMASNEEIIEVFKVVKNWK